MKKMIIFLLTTFALTTAFTPKPQGDDFTEKFDAYTLAIWDLADAVASETQDIDIKEQALVDIENDLFNSYADVEGEIAERSFYYNLCHVIASVGYMDCSNRISRPRMAYCLEEFRSFMQTCYSIVRQHTVK